MRATMYDEKSRANVLIGGTTVSACAISTSGNARDVLLAVSVAKALGLCTAALSGRNGGLLKRTVDVAVVVPEKTTRQIQQVHQAIYHTLCLMLEQHFYG